MLNLCQNLFDYGDNAKDTSLLEVKKFDFACSNFHSLISHCFGHLTSVDPHFLPGPTLFGFWYKVLSFKRKKQFVASRSYWKWIFEFPSFHIFVGSEVSIHFKYFLLKNKDKIWSMESLHGFEVATASDIFSGLDFFAPHDCQSFNSQWASWWVSIVQSF